jgi:hypothetical protein
MSTPVVIKRGRTGGQRVTLYRPTKPVTTPPAERHRALRTAQAAQGTNSDYYGHLAEARDQTNNKTRSTAMPPVNRSDAADTEGVGRSSAQSRRPINESDEGRHPTATLTADQRSKLLARKKDIERMMKLQRKSYNADEGTQREYRDIVDRLGVPA